MVCVGGGTLIQVWERLNMIQEVQFEWLIHAFEGLSVGKHKTVLYSTVMKYHLINFIFLLSSHEVTDRIYQECVLVHIASIAIIAQHRVLLCCWTTVRCVVAKVESGETFLVHNATFFVCIMLKIKFLKVTVFTVYSFSYLLTQVTLGESSLFHYWIRE